MKIIIYVLIIVYMGDRAMGDVLVFGDRAEAEAQFIKTCKGSGLRPWMEEDIDDIGDSGLIAMAGSDTRIALYARELIQ